MSCDDQCISVFLHEGKPTGSFSKFEDVKVYVSNPPTIKFKDKAILIFPDGCGIELKNTQLISDKFSNEVGVRTYLIDYFGGDPIPEPEPGQQLPQNFSLKDWLPNHGPEVIIPLIQKVINHLKSQGIDQFAATGYCFGGKYVIEYAKENKIKVGALSHPSLLKNPEDIQELLENSNVPILINSCEIDSQFDHEFQKVTDKILGQGKYGPGYKRNYYSGASHGFGCRADLSNGKEKEAFDESFDEVLNWFKNYF